MTIPDIPKYFKIFDNKVFEQIEQQSKMIKTLNRYIPVYNEEPIEFTIPPDPAYMTNKLLSDQNGKIDDLSLKLEEANLEISKQTQELKSIHYENMKLNAQIDTLNKIIDSQNDELERLRNINAELKLANKTLEKSNESNRGYWIKTILIGIFTTVLGFLLGKYL